jgi:hypothetical protein
LVGIELVCAIDVGPDVGDGPGVFVALTITMLVGIGVVVFCITDV